MEKYFSPVVQPQQKLTTLILSVHTVIKLMVHKLNSDKTVRIRNDLPIPPKTIMPKMYTTKIMQHIMSVQLLKCQREYKFKI